ncbi:hypothetical protein HPB51_023107 [Rhipicephalus microplus]|uniref:Uncharacterized protein n=1 Tax=Rhipicephalus microplus TaxID=6941 RepID=A0A9J6DJ47_RHIMP|nr:hypothetical protein HPB51_023107 [Rhipicephalus microplus]
MKSSLCCWWWACEMHFGVYHISPPSTFRNRALPWRTHLDFSLCCGSAGRGVKTRSLALIVPVSRARAFAFAGSACRGCGASASRQHFVVVIEWGFHGVACAAAAALPCVCGVVGAALIVRAPPSVLVARLRKCPRKQVIATKKSQHICGVNGNWSEVPVRPSVSVSRRARAAVALRAALSMPHQRSDSYGDDPGD